QLAAIESEQRPEDGAAAGLDAPEPERPRAPTGAQQDGLRLIVAMVSGGDEAKAERGADLLEKVVAGAACFGLEPGAAASGGVDGASFDPALHPEARGGSGGGGRAL